MKKLITLLIPVMFIAFFSGCADDFQDTNLENQKENYPANSSISQIMDFANAEAEHFFPSTSRSEVRVASLEDLKVITANLSRSCEEDTLIYVVNYSDNKGFALISAKDRINPLLAIVPEGHFDPEVGTDNPGFNMFIESAKSNIARVGKLDPIWGNDPSIPYVENGKYVKYKTNIVEEINIDSKLGTDFRWNQLSPKGFENVYGSLCPNKTVGCVPLAMGSVIAYHNAKYSLTSTMNYTFDERERDSEEVNWADVFSHKSSLEIYHDKTINWGDCSCSPSNHRTIAHILRQLGKDTKTNYLPDSTTATAVSRMPGALKKYIDTNKVSSLLRFNEINIKNELKEGVVLVSAIREGEVYGHTWILDGLSYKRIFRERYESDMDLSISPTTPTYNWQLVSSETQEIILCYSHWGWGGEYDGWFNNTYYEPEKTPSNLGNPYNIQRCVTVKD